MPTIPDELSAYKQQILSSVLRNSGIPDFWDKKRFNQLNGDEKYKEKINEIEKWDFKEPISYTLLSSGNGVGKTHIAICLLRKYLFLRMSSANDVELQAFSKRSYNYFFKESEIYRRVQESYREKSSEKESDIINELTRKPFLIIDDLFSSRDNDFARRVMLDLIDARIDWYRFPTVITSNLSMKEIQDIDTRIASRLMNGQIISFENKTDYRGK